MANSVPWKTNLWWVSREASSFLEIFLFTLFESPPACCDCSPLAVWCSDSHDFPSPSPRRAPFCGGKGWLNSSQLRALQRCWQACLPEYAIHTSVHVCVHVCTCGWSAMHKIKAHDTGTPAVMSDDASSTLDFGKNVFFFILFFLQMFDMRDVRAHAVYQWDVLSNCTRIEKKRFPWKTVSALLCCIIVWLVMFDS